jgi:hypothetical protein
MPGNPTIDELRHLSPAAFFRRWGEAAYESPSDDANAEHEILGTVFEGEDVAHVLYRSSFRTFDLPAQVMRMPLRYANGHWRIVLNEEIGDPFALPMRAGR